MAYSATPPTNSIVAPQHRVSFQAHRVAAIRQKLLGIFGIVSLTGSTDTNTGIVQYGTDRRTSWYWYREFLNLAILPDSDPRPSYPSITHVRLSRQDNITYCKQAYLVVYPLNRNKLNINIAI